MTPHWIIIALFSSCFGATDSLESQLLEDDISVLDGYFLMKLLGPSNQHKLSLFENTY